MVDSGADIDIKAPRFAEQGVVLRRKAALTVADAIVLLIGRGFNDHAPEQAAVVLAFHQPAAHQIGAHDLSQTGKKLSGSETKSMTDRRLAATLVSA